MSYMYRRQALKILHVRRGRDYVLIIRDKQCMYSGFLTYVDHGLQIHIFVEGERHYDLIHIVIWKYVPEL